MLSLTLGISLAAHIAILLLEHVLAPSPTRHHELAARTDPSRAHSRSCSGAAPSLAGGLLPLPSRSSHPATAVTPIVAASLLALAGGARVGIHLGRSRPVGAELMSTRLGLVGPTPGGQVQVQRVSTVTAPVGDHVSRTQSGSIT